MSQVIEKTGADIWLLQEIESAEALARVFPPGWTFHVESRAETTNRPPCRGRPQNRLRHQATAIAIRPGIAHDRLPDLEALDVEGWGLLRWGTAIALPDHGGLQILNVHLKSGCFERDEASACQQLFAQVPVVAGWIAGREGPAIVGGDLNRRLELPGDRVWQVLNVAAGPLHLAGDGIRPECFPRFTEFIDFFVLNDSARAMKPPGAFEEVTFTQGPPASDHCPIVIELAP